MAKKKSPQKKHKFKHAESAAVVSQPTSVPSRTVIDSNPAGAPRAIIASAHTVSAGSAYSYVGPDIRRTAILSVILIATELVLNYVMIHSELGKAIYALVRV